MGTLLATDQDTHESKVSLAAKKTEAQQKAVATTEEAGFQASLRSGNWARPGPAG